MGEDTIKRVVVPYVVDDTHAIQPLGRIAQHADHAGHATERLKEKFQEFRGSSMAMAAGVLGLGFGFGELISKVGEANREFGGATKAIGATMTTLLDWPKTMAPIDKFTHSMALAKVATRELDQTAGKFNMSLQDLGGIYKTVGISAGPMHLSQKQWMDLTVKSAAAAKALGADASQAGDMIGKLLMGKNIKLAGDLGKTLSNEVGKNLGKLHGQARFDKLSQELEKFVPVAEQMGKGFGGAINRIQLKVSELTRDLTGPLFSAIGKSLDGLSSKLSQIGEDGKPLIAEYANNLVQAFSSAADVSHTILGYWDAIAAKIKSASGGVGSMGGAATGAMVGGYLGGVPGALIGAGAGAIGGEMFNQKMAHDAGVDRLKSYKDLLSSVRGVQETAGESGMPGSDIKFQAERAKPLISQIEKMQLNDPGVRGEKLSEMRMLIAAAGDDTAKALGMSAKEALALSTKLKELISNFGDELTPSFLTKKAVSAVSTDANRRTTGKPEINFNNNHFEFKWEDVDPDRSMLRFQDDMENYVGRRTSSALSDPFGD